MKLFKKTLILVGTLVTFITLFTFFSVNTHALSINYNGEDDTIYYFTDYYPTIEEDTLSTEYPNYNVVYDHQWITEQQFNNMVSGNYFTGFGDNCVVIIDIKTFAPSHTVLNSLFLDLKTNQNCTTALVTLLNTTDFANNDFLLYVDVYFTSDLSKLTDFVALALADYEQDIVGWSNTTILIDGRLADSRRNINFGSWKFDHSFLKVLLDTLAYELGLQINNYSDFIETLANAYNINLLVDMGNGTYSDLNTGISYTAYTVEDLQNDDLTWDNICAFGFSSLENDFYDFLEDGQDSESYLPVYLFVVDPVTYGTEGLMAITDEDLYDINTEGALFLEELAEVIV